MQNIQTKEKYLYSKPAFIIDVVDSVLDSMSHIPGSMATVPRETGNCTSATCFESIRNGMVLVMHSEICYYLKNASRVRAKQRPCAFQLQPSQVSTFQGTQDQPGWADNKLGLVGRLT